MDRNLHDTEAYWKCFKPFYFIIVVNLLFSPKVPFKNFSFLRVLISQLYRKRLLKKYNKIKLLKIVNII